MDIKRSGSQPANKGPAEWFTGTVRIDPLFAATEPARAAGNRVAFEPGARTAWIDACGYGRQVGQKQGASHHELDGRLYRRGLYNVFTGNPANDDFPIFWEAHAIAEMKKGVITRCNYSGAYVLAPSDTGGLNEDRRNRQARHAEGSGLGALPAMELRIYLLQ